MTFSAGFDFEVFYFFPDIHTVSCLSVTCMNDGICQALGHDGAKCDCQLGFTGTFCETSKYYISNALNQRESQCTKTLDGSLS